ncbi:excalibur calcium-binding domain-containing protein [Staphylococcus aureus]
MKITYKYRGDLPLNTENNKNQNQSVKNSERRGMLKGCGGCLISFILLIILLSACSMMFSNNDNSTNNQSSKTQLTQKDENKNEDKPEEKSETATDEDLQSTEEVPANENTENNQHEIDEITTKDQSDDDINTPNVAEDKSQDDLKDDLKEKQQSFANCKQLRQVYPNGVTADHPAYRPHLDRDKDKRACEPDKY